MKALLRGAVAALVFLATSGAAMATETPLMAPIHQFIDSFDKGDAKAAAKAFAPGSVSIIDEVPPHIWTGPAALQHWAKDLASASKAEGLTDEAVTLGTATREDINGDRGYVVVPAVFAYTEKGTPMREAAQMVYALKKTAQGWQITGWTWTGGTPAPAGAAAK